MFENNNLYNKAYRFAIEIVNIFIALSKEQKEFVLSKQLLRCGTSIGANIAEAQGAISKLEFSAKLSIAYKECLETKYWLCLLKDTKFIDTSIYNNLFSKAEEISKILYSIIKKTRITK